MTNVSVFRSVGIVFVSFPLQNDPNFAVRVLCLYNSQYDSGQVTVQLF